MRARIDLATEGAISFLEAHKVLADEIVGPFGMPSLMRARSSSS